MFSKVAGTGETEIRLSGLASGVYILKLEKDGDSSCHKLIRK
ncbi:MAG: T9SS type A sorting domain-containing protein [Barnesiella intestinihominis]